MKALSRWPKHLKSFGRELSEATEAARAVKGIDMSLEYILPLAEWSAMMARTLTTKTLKNYQAMGTALMWVVEVRIASRIQGVVNLNDGVVVSQRSVGHLYVEESYRRYTSWVRPFPLNSHPLLTSLLVYRTRLPKLLKMLREAKSSARSYLP